MLGNSHGMLLTDSIVCEYRTLDNEARDSSIYPTMRMSRESSLLTNNSKVQQNNASTQSRALTTYASTFAVNDSQTKRSRYQIRQARSNLTRLRQYHMKVTPNPPREWRQKHSAVSPSTHLHSCSINLMRAAENGRYK
ncbi:hypothetical protein L207DRAFT_131170 [Hyaloscypha variabilis F]|uniref:Uncharacterized protein n=1 Tax=Hyaloscypha variabilis (strain UAMH 11265 / GT02V1 / F) TaxID=1149755 RepID=A0A2J6R934_HYAVF|nr:hypothetical protein L207DRAFT_131170 [Hyaloscypha variabilis F]